MGGKGKPENESVHALDHVGGAIGVQSEPWLNSWASNELEKVSFCPVCGHSDRILLQDNLVDNVFFVAPGCWSLFQCAHCQNAYLDPRPSLSSIGKAYVTYYTHVSGVDTEPYERLNVFRRFRRTLVNGYINYKHGTKYQPANRLGIAIALLLPRWRHAIAVQFRFLPKPEAGRRLLDIGCGNGDFLNAAQQAGWEVMGLDLDPQAAALRRGFNVKIGTIDLFDNDSECFDAVTISHVIEHVHEPVKVLRAIYRLLKPGGLLYIETPNVNSNGLRIFGRHWRGLEVPRHLVLFSFDGLVDVLARIGFQGISCKPRDDVMTPMFLKSLRIKRGLPPEERYPARLPWLMQLVLQCKRPFVTAEKSEFIALMASKGTA